MAKTFKNLLPLASVVSAKRASERDFFDLTDEPQPASTPAIIPTAVPDSGNIDNTLVQGNTGNHQDGASYLELAEFLQRQGAHVADDLVELWRRIVFNICISNTDDHLRNHGFLLTPEGWRLSPAFDLNPVPLAYGLTLNISETDNALSLALTREVAPFFRVSVAQAAAVQAQVVGAVQQWRAVASTCGIGRGEQEEMAGAFAAATE